jgi:hypothetical protein
MARIVELQGHHPLLLEDGSRVLETVCPSSDARCSS